MTVLAGLLVFMAASDAVAQTCRREGLRPEVPVVASPQTARAIFVAVEDDLLPSADKRAYPQVVVRDEGETWSVFRDRADEAQRGAEPSGRTVGGGQLSLRIAKCDARVSEVWLTR